ncbi:MAG TPA: hypothetical protein DCE41_09090 [Cytophagales bacterium]|nr:hypothetical protein [Cytophagales bacterium]
MGIHQLPPNLLQDQQMSVEIRLIPTRRVWWLVPVNTDGKYLSLMKLFHLTHQIPGFIKEVVERLRFDSPAQIP